MAREKHTHHYNLYREEVNKLTQELIEYDKSNKETPVKFDGLTRFSGPIARLKLRVGETLETMKPEERNLLEQKLTCLSEAWEDLTHHYYSKLILEKGRK